jgi:hypothetical protein
MNAPTTTIPATGNSEWGFWGTMGEHAPAAWPLAMTAISDATCLPLESVRAFLDSSHGRHFADEVLMDFQTTGALAQAIDTSVAQWMTWTIGRKNSKTHGIPMGLPYLTGFVIHAEVSETSAEV